jgi:hypothetical protein
MISTSTAIVAQVKTATRAKAKRVACLIVVMGLASCAQLDPQIAPWERDVLARGHMMPDPHPTYSGIRSHMYQSRESAARIKPAGSGSACGCY